ncbi:hypothetical protein DL93DRAFT_1667311, partial [Clavulina sp. PMI_390]
SPPVPFSVPGLELSGYTKPSTTITICGAGHRFSRAPASIPLLSAKPFVHFAEETIINVEIETLTEENQSLHRRFLISAKPEGKIACLYDHCNWLPKDLTLQEQALGLWQWSSPSLIQTPVRRRMLRKFVSLLPKSTDSDTSNKLLASATTHTPTFPTDPQESASSIASDPTRSWFTAAESVISFDGDLNYSSPPLAAQFNFPARLYDEFVRELPLFAGCCPRSGTWAYKRAVTQTSPSPLPTSRDVFVSFTILKYD